MYNFDKQYDIRHVLERFVTEEELISAVFQDIPELLEFTFSVTSEYDDNNYSTYTRVSTINGRHVDYDADYDEDEDESNEMPKIECKESREKIMELVDLISEKWGFGEDHRISRDNYVPKPQRKRPGQVFGGSISRKPESEEVEYVRAYMNGTTLPDDYFTKLDNKKWAVYYADDHGRFSPELEFKIFAKQGEMRSALRYAQAIKAPLHEKVENFFVLNNSKDDKKHLQMYLDFKKNLSPKKIRA